MTPYRTEWMIWDKDHKLAGSIDMIFENEDGTLSIYDWKRSKEIKKQNKWQPSQIHARVGNSGQYLNAVFEGSDVEIY